MEAGHKEKHFFFEKLLRVCVMNGGEVRGLGVRGKGRWKERRKRRLFVENYGEVSLKG